MGLQNALDCKTCPNGTLSAILAVVIGAVLYLIGIVLGNRVAVDKEIAIDSNQIQHRGKVRSRPTSPRPQLTRSHAAIEGAETTAEANSRPEHCFFIIQAAHGALLVSSVPTVSLSCRCMPIFCQQLQESIGSGNLMSLVSWG